MPTMFTAAHEPEPTTRSIGALAALLLSLVCLPAAGQVNKCLDKEGKVVAYASECPPGTRTEPTGIRNAPSASGAQKSLAERDADFRKRQLEQKEAAQKSEKTAAEQRERAQACESSQSYLKSLQSGQRIRTTDPKTGEPGFLADAEYPKEIAAAQKAVTANCK
jgi:hypothetical protein